MQNKANFCLFHVKNEDLQEKQSQFKPNSNPIQSQFGYKNNIRTIENNGR
jgi:hypothetical protein